MRLLLTVFVSLLTFQMSLADGRNVTSNRVRRVHRKALTNRFGNVRGASNRAVRLVKEESEDLKRERALYETRRLAITNAPLQMDIIHGYVLGASIITGGRISLQAVPSGLTRTQYDKWLDSNVRNAFPFPFGEAKPSSSANHRLCGIHSMWNTEGIETTNDISVLLRGFLRKMEMRYGIKFPDPLCIFDMGDQEIKRIPPPANGEQARIHYYSGRGRNGYCPLYEGVPQKVIFECEAQAGDTLFSLKSVGNRLSRGPCEFCFSITSERWKNDKTPVNWPPPGDKVKSYKFANETEEALARWYKVTLFDLTNSTTAVRTMPEDVKREAIRNLPKEDFQEWMRFSRIEKRARLRNAVKEYSELLNLPANR